eukprot:5666753-Amphidinium_carterae.1
MEVDSSYIPWKHMAAGRLSVWQSMRSQPTQVAPCRWLSKWAMLLLLLLRSVLTHSCQARICGGHKELNEWLMEVPAVKYPFKMIVRETPKAEPLGAVRSVQPLVHEWRDHCPIASLLVLPGTQALAA